MNTGQLRGRPVFGYPEVFEMKKMLGAARVWFAIGAARRGSVPDDRPPPPRPRRPRSAGGSWKSTAVSGQGRRILWSENAAVLIDTGESGFGKTIVSYLKDAGIGALDALILTHFDQDHVGGAAKVLSGVTVRAVYASDCPKDSKEYAKYLTALETAGLTAVTVREKTEFTLGGAVFSISPPEKTAYQTDESNNSSLITSVRCGQTRFLFAGDAEDDRIREFLAENPGSYDFLKVPYHGHWQTSLQELIDETAPEYAVITSSDDEPEDGQTVAALKAAGAQVFLTREGGVLAVTDGSSVTVTQE